MLGLIFFIIWFIVLIVIQIVYLVKSIKTGSNKKWGALFSIIIASMVSTGILPTYSHLNIDNHGLAGIMLYYLLAIMAFSAFTAILLVSTVCKIVEVKKHKKLNITREKLDKASLKKVITVFLTIILISTCICILDYLSHRQVIIIINRLLKEN